MKSKYSELIPQLNDQYVISYEDNKDFNINEINEYSNMYPNDDIIVEIPNTKGITSSMIKKINSNVHIRIAGAYTYERMNAEKGKIFTNKSGKRSALSYYYASVVYTREETINILEEIENVESHINKNWSDIQKLVYLYTTLKRKITYDPEFEYKSDEEVRSLRGLTSGETVCAGYSLILKEFLDRQDINCMWVGGNKHAWNIVEIEGKLYPVDITFENKRFREGIQESYSFLGQNVTLFNLKHRPAKDEINNGYQDKLCEFDIELLKIVAATAVLEEEYEKITFKCERSNKSRFMLTQIDTRKDKNGETYYIYYCDEIINDRLANKPLILASKETISRYVDNVNFDKENIFTSKDICDLLFSEENIKDSIDRRSLYVGEFINYRMILGYSNKLRKEEKDLKLFRIPPKVYPKEDGSVLVAEKAVKEPIVIGDSRAYKYYLYDVTYNKENKPVLRKRTVYSDIDFIYSNNDEIQNKLLSEENLSNSIKNNSGYIGFINELGELTYNNQLLRQFDKRINYTVRDYEETKRTR